MEENKFFGALNNKIVRIFLAIIVVIALLAIGTALGANLGHYRGERAKNYSYRFERGMNCQLENQEGRQFRGKRGRQINVQRGLPDNNNNIIEYVPLTLDNGVPAAKPIATSTVPVISQ